MPLQNPNPIIIPTTAEKSFPHLWLYNINIHAPSINTGRISIETLPYNSDNLEIGAGDMMIPISTDQLWEAVNEVPEVAQAMAAIFAAVEPLRDWTNKTGIYSIAPPIDPAPAPLDTSEP